MAPPVRSGQWCALHPCPRAFGARDKAVMLPATLRAPQRSFPKPSRVRPCRGPRVVAGTLRFPAPRTVAALRALLAPPPRSSKARLQRRHLDSRQAKLLPSSAPRRGEADGPHRAQAKPLVWRRTLPASTQCEAGSMTALSRASNARGHRFQMHHDPLQARRPTSRLAV